MAKTNQDLIKYEIDTEREKDLIANRDEYDNLFKHKYSVLDSNIKTAIQLKDIAIGINRDDATSIINTYGYFNLLSYDLVSVGYNLYFEQERWRKIYFARQVALLIYEAFEDIPVITGKIFKIHFEEVRGIKAADDFLEELKSLGKKLNKLKSDNREYLLNIRINVAAHRDLDINKQLDIITNINPYSIIAIMTDLENILKAYNNLLQDLIVRLVKAGKN